MNETPTIGSIVRVRSTGELRRVSSIVRYAEKGNTEEPDTCESALVVNGRGEVFASLGCIDDADDAYRATIEADLLADARSQASR